MIQEHFGDTVDIHGGGTDLQFPHHENELAQGTCCTDNSNGYVKYWVHNAMLLVDGEKMSKSLGNFIVLRDMLAKQPPELVRTALLSAHYRSNLDWSSQLLHQSRSLLDRLYTIKQDPTDFALGDIPDIKQTEFFNELLDDLNTPKAFAVLHDRINRFFKADDNEKAPLKAEIFAITRFLNIGNLEADEWFHGNDDGGLSAKDIEAFIEQRAQAKKNKDYAGADRIRDQLAKQGITIKDTREGTMEPRTLMKWILIGLVNVYRFCISPLFGPTCRYYPSCSEYAIIAIREYGALKGGWMAFKRVSRCHPGHPGGIDPVPGVALPNNSEDKPS